MRPATWTKERVIGAIQSHHRQGKPLTSIWRENRTLMSMAWKHFGSWHNALSAAGFSSKPRRKWSKDRLIEALRAIARDKCSFSQIRETDPSLGYATRMLFGGWHAAMRAAGLPLIERWTRQRIMDSLLDRRCRGVPMTRIRQEEPLLYQAAIRLFGTWRKALAAIGVKLPRPRKWSKDAVIAELRRRHQRGCNLSRVCREDDALRGAAGKYFGGWRRAILAAGLPPTPRREWSKDRIIAILHAWQQERTNTAQVWKEDPSLYHASKRFFGSWNNAISAARIEPNRHHWTAKRVIETIQSRLAAGTSVKAIWSDLALASAAGVYFGGRSGALAAAGLNTEPPRRWSKRMVLDAIRARHRQGLPMSNIGKYDGTLASAAVRRFGGWGSAMEAAGLERLHRQWSKELIVRELRAWHRAGMSSRNVPLDAAAICHFGSMGAAYVAAGIDPYSNNRWSQQRVIEAIQDRHVRGLSLKSKDDCNLSRAGARLFGSWNAAIAAAGIPVAEKTWTCVRWTSAEVLDEIRGRHKNGVNVRNLSRTAPDLVAAAKKHLGGWYHALSAAGINLKPCNRWSHQKIIADIRVHDKQGTLSQIWRIDQLLLNAGCKRFGSWRKALKAAGFEPTRQRWSKERVLHELHVRYQRSQHNITVTAPGLYHAIRRYFGSRLTAYEVAGLPPKRCHWSAQRVVKTIQDYHNRGLAIHRAGFGEVALAQAAKQRFGSWHGAVSAAGLADKTAPPKIARKWTKEAVIAAILARHRQGLHLAKVYKDDTGFYTAGKKHFGTWNNALMAAGVQSTRRRWTKDVVIEEIRAWYMRGLRISAISRKDNNLTAAAIRLFGTWRKALNAAELGAKPGKQERRRGVTSWRAGQETINGQVPLHDTKDVLQISGKGRAICHVKPSSAASSGENRRSAG